MLISKLSKHKSKSKQTKKQKVAKPAKRLRIMHVSYVKKLQVTDPNKPDGVKENPFIIKNRSISKGVNSIIVGIQQPIIKLLGLTEDTWYKEYCDPISKTIFLEVYEKPNE